MGMLKIYTSFANKIDMRKYEIIVKGEFCGAKVLTLFLEKTIIVNELQRQFIMI